jgi:DNA-binding MarR family transcriptional regulator
MILCTYSNELIQLENNDYSYLVELFIQWKKQKDLKLNKKLLEILKYFISNQFNPSSYQCYKYLETRKILDLDKKNVRRNVKKLHDLGLLEEKRPENKNGRRRHNATFYKVSPFGVFYILKEGIMNNPFNFTFDIILKNRNFKLYDSVLFKFIKFESIQSIENRYIINKILIYLNRICQMIENIFAIIEEKDKRVDLFELYFDLLYKHEMRDHLLELCIGILSFNSKYSFSKNTNEGDIYPDVKHDLLILKKDKIFVTTAYSLQQYAMDLYNDFKNLKS